MTTSQPNDRFLHLRNLYSENALLLDISRWQGKMDFNLAKLRGIVGIFTRVTIADYYTDILVNSYAEEIEKAGLPRGDYHVTRADISPIKQMDRYYRDRPSGDTPPALGTVLDNEISGKNVTIQINKKKTKIEYKKFNRRQVTDNVLAQKDIIEARDGITPMNYTQSYFYWDLMINNEEIKEMPLWLAQFKVDIPGNLRRGKNIFDIVGIPRSDLVMWQALADGDDQGPYFGSSSHGLDVNFFMKGEGTYQDFLNHFNFSDSDIPDPEPIPVDCNEIYNKGYQVGRDKILDPIYELLQKL